MEKIFDQCHIDLQTSRFYSNYSHRFIQEFHQHNGLKPIFAILANQELIDMYRNLAAYKLSGPLSASKKATRKQSQDYVRVNRVIRDALGLLFNLSRGYSNNSTKWKELDSAQILFGLLDRIGNLEDNQMTLNMLIAAIISDKEIDTYPQIKQAIPEIAQVM